LEASEQLPMTWASIKDVVMQMMQGGNPMVMSTLMSPENIPFVKRAIGVSELAIPGEDDRNKQYEEIRLLLQSEPIPGPDGQMAPSVDVDPNVDDNQIEADICRRWAVSDAGRLAKTENPPGYTNVLLHMKRHIDLQQAQAGMMQTGPPNGPPNGPPPNGPPPPQGGSPNKSPNPIGDNKARPMAAPLPRRGNNAVIQ